MNFLRKALDTEILTQKQWFTVFNYTFSLFFAMICAGICWDIGTSWWVSAIVVHLITFRATYGVVTE